MAGIVKATTEAEENPRLAELTQCRFDTLARRASLELALYCNPAGMVLSQTGVAQCESGGTHIAQPRGTASTPASEPRRAISKLARWVGVQFTTLFPS